MREYIKIKFSLSTLFNGFNQKYAFMITSSVKCKFCLSMLLYGACCISYYELQCARKIVLGIKTQKFIHSAVLLSSYCFCYYRRTMRKYRRRCLHHLSTDVSVCQRRTPQLNTELTIQKCITHTSLPSSGLYLTEKRTHATPN